MKIFFTLLIIALFSSTGCAQSTGTIEAAQFDKLIKEKKGLQLIDVRTAQEFKEGHIKGAINIDYYKSDFKQLLAKLDKSKPIAVYCTVGGRSGAGAKIVQQLGFKEVYDLEGGIVLWQRNGYKLVKE